VNGRRASVWPRYPVVYEINTWVWLSELSRQYEKRINLSSIPPAEWDAIAAYGFDAVWLMGVWERSLAGIAIANRNQGLLGEFRRALPDFCPEDNVGSPYCVRGYVVDEHLGGPEGLATARKELSERGVKLLLDFVPNHLAPDHLWVNEHPEYFIRGNGDDLRSDPASFMEVEGRVFACGRDPYFPAWPDVLQLNAFSPGLRLAAIGTLNSIAEQCDGVRCDMAMLFLNAVFEHTWGARVGPVPATEYWSDVIPAMKSSHPGFLFIAEAYWDLEWELQQLEFDFCYDKKLYDRLEHSNAERVRLHLCAEPAYQNKLLRFIENHDEPRAAAVFAPAKLRAAALTIATIPGLKLFHEGQFAGRTVKLPVFLGRRPDEPVDRDQQAFFQTVLAAVNQPVFRDGEWSLCQPTGWPDNASFQNLLAWSWRKDDQRWLIVINFSDRSAQGQLQIIAWPELKDEQWRLTDALSGAVYERSGKQMLSPGLYVDLSRWSYHLLQFERAKL
jgi:Alpha amylase, catalytic domain